jgi:CRISPR/Cas system CSM-associated protein Csm3 (group 7 of RAMP superfamily)
MNPYDFARIDWEREPERRRPVWHHRLTGGNEQPFYSGQLDVDVYVETPLFIADPRAVLTDLRRPAQSIRNRHGAYIIPGSSLKGMLRNVVETLGNGCLTFFSGQYEGRKINYTAMVPPAFQHCSNNTNLCIACRIFGMLKEGAHGVFLGKINIGDASAYPDTVQLYDAIYTKPLMEPKPHHASFYLDPSGQRIAGRKFYFHHEDLLTDNRIITMGGRPANRYIQPLDINTRFHFRIDFTTLEADEFAALLLAIALEKDMRHKIGYGKPLGLGSVYLFPTRLLLVNYGQRYTQPGAERGKTILEEESGLWDFINKQLDEFYVSHLARQAMDDLRRIWRWPPYPDVEYYYPSKPNWFDTQASIGKRIADTRSVPR